MIRIPTIPTVHPVRCCYNWFLISAITFPSIIFWFHLYFNSWLHFFEKLYLLIRGSLQGSEIHIKISFHFSLSIVICMLKQIESGYKIINADKNPIKRCLTWKFRKIILLKLTDKVRFHLNISSTMRKNCKLVSRLEVIEENCAKCYLLLYLVWWPRFLISKQHFRWFLL